jgi:hypothetical protein
MNVKYIGRERHWLAGRQILRMALGLFSLLALGAVGSALAAESVTLAWDASTDTNVVGYKVYYAASGSFAPNSLNAGSTNRARITGLTAGTLYSFYVTAYDKSAVESDPSNVVDYTPTNSTPPNVAPILVAIPDQVATAGTLFTLTARASDANLPAQVLTYSLAPGAPAGVTLDAVTGVLTWTPTKAQGRTTNLLAILVTDNGSPALSDSRSFQVVVNPMVSAVAAPNNLVAALSSSKKNIALTWADNSSNEAGFQVESSLDGMVFNPVGLVGAGVTSFTVTNAGTYSLAVYPYTFRVCAFKGTDFSDYSNLAVGTTNQANLVIDSVSVTPTYLSEGTNALFSATVKNKGRGFSPSNATMRVNFYVDGGSPVAWAAITNPIGPNGTLVVAATGSPQGTNTWSAVQGSHTLSASFEAVSGFAWGNASTNVSSTGFSVASTNGPPVTLSLNTTNVLENATTVIRLTVTRTGSTTASLPVNLNFGGTAQVGTHVTAITNTVVIAAGSLSKTVQFNVVDDVLLNPTRTLTMTVAPSANYRPGNPYSTTLFIRDDDVDTDGDGQSDAAEVIAGTSKTDATSLLKIVSVQPSASGTNTITWQSVANIKYSVQKQTVPGGAWTTASSVVQATGTRTSVGVQAVGGLGLYKIRVEP